MPGPPAFEAYKIHQQQVTQGLYGFKDESKKRRKPGLLDYLIGGGTGAAFGALAGLGGAGIGAVPGAFIGAGTGLAATYAGPKAAAALPKGTPEWARTATEFGVYGVTAPLGFGGAAGGGSRVLSRLALSEALKIGLLSGVGAAGGQEFAKVIGAPPALGTLAGGIAAPIGGPLAWRSARGSLAAAAGSERDGWAKALAGALKIQPTQYKESVGTVKIGNREHDIESQTNMAGQAVRTAVNKMGLRETPPKDIPREHLLRVAVREEVIRPGTYKGGISISDASGVRMLEPGMNPGPGERVFYQNGGFDDSEWLALTGYTKADAQALSQGHPVGRERELLTPQFKKDRRWLEGYNRRIAALTQESEKEAAVSHKPSILRVAVAEGAAAAPAEEGLAASQGALQITNTKGARILKAGQKPKQGETVYYHGTAGDIKGTVLKEGTFITPSRKDAATYAKIESNLRQRQKMRPGGPLAKLHAEELKFRTRMSLPEDMSIPATFDEQLQLLRNFHAPGVAELNAGAIPDQATMSKLYQAALAKERQFAIDTTTEVRKLFEQAGSRRMLAEYLSNPNNFPGQAIAPQMKDSAARTLAGIRAKELLLATHPAGFTTAKESVESFEDYMQQYVLAAAKAQSGGRAARLEGAFADFFNNPRGSVYMQDETGVMTPKILAGVPKKDGDQWLVPVRDAFQAVADADWVPRESLVMRYTPEQLSARAAEWAKAATDLRVGARTRKELAAIEEQIAGVREPEPLASERYFPDRASYENAVQQAVLEGKPPPSPTSPILRDEIDAAWKEFSAHFVPEENSVTGWAPEVVQARIKGNLKLATLAPQHSLSRADALAYVEAKQWMQTSYLERLRERIAVDDPELMASLGIANPLEHGIDPVVGYIDLLASGPDELMDMVLPQATGLTKMFGSSRQFLSNTATGVVVTDPRVRAVLHSYFPMLEALSTEVGANRVPIIIEMQREAARRAGAPQGARAQVGAGIKAAFSVGPHPMRAASAFVKEVHPLSVGAEELAAWKRTAFSIKGLQASNFPRDNAFAKKLLALGERDPGRMAEFIDWFAQNPESHIEYPAAFPDLANNRTMRTLAGLWQSFDETDLKIAQDSGSKALSQAQKFSMMTARDLRDDLTQEVIQRDQADIMDLVNEVLRATSAKGHPAAPLAKLLTTGHEAALAGPMAYKHALTLNEAVKQLKSLADINPETGLKWDFDDANDILFKGGSWKIRSLNKFPPEMRDSLKGMADILSGVYGGLESVTRASQTVALGVLAADFSLIGIHGFKFAAQSLLSGHPVKAVSVLTNGLTHIMSDYGFYSWLKTNHEEVSYYLRKGLTGGLKGYIAGPEITRMPLESVPLLGKAFTGARMFSDLQYNRMLFYWKVEAVRMNMEFAKNMRLLTSDLSTKFVDASPTQKAVEQGLGGHTVYRTASDDDLLAMTIRQVQNSLGGVDMRARGVGVKRQAMEQIMAIVPGFTRAQIGQWASILTKPHTLEGWLAASMAGREAMFAGSLAIGFSRMFGTEHLINWGDPTKSDWLSVHLPEGGYVTLMPTMAVPRLLSRVVDQTAKGAAGITSGEGGGFEYEKALESFAHGRLSPVAGSVYDAMTNKDFLGRHYTSNLDRWSSALERTVLPVVMQQIIEDTKESLRSGGIDLQELTLDAGANILGKSYVPDSPRIKLDKMAQQAFGSDWAMLTDAQRYTMRQSNPGVAATEAEFKFYTNRRATTEEAHVDQAYEWFKQTSDSVWQEPRTINSFASSQADDDALLKAGQMDGDTWRERYHARQDAVSNAYDAMVARLNAEGVDPDKQKVKRLQRLATTHNVDDATWLLQLAKTEYQGVTLPLVPNTISTPDGDVTIQVVDWDAFASQREQVLAQYPEAIRNAVLATAPDTAPGIAAYKEAARWQKAVEALPRYRGLTVDQGDQLDQMRSVLNAARQEVSLQMGLAPGQKAPTGVSAVSKQLAVQEMQKQGLLATPDDVKLLTIMFALDGNDQLAMAMMNPQQIALILAHPDSVVFYPYLQYRVPLPLRKRLPAQISPLAQAQGQAALAGGR